MQFRHDDRVMQARIESTCGSVQVFRALRPAVSSEASNALLAGLAKCLANPSRLSLEVAADVVLTLQVRGNLSAASHSLCIKLGIWMCVMSCPQATSS